MTTKVIEKLETLVKEKKLSVATLQETPKTEYDPWERARGLLKYKKIDPLKYQKRIRKEWEK